MPPGATTIEIRPEHANIMVGCPDPRGQGQDPMTLGELAKTGHGGEMLATRYADMAETYDVMIGTGKSREDALRLAFSAIAIKDAQNNVVMAEEAAKKK